MWRKIPLWIHKLFLSLLVIAGLVDIIRRGYELFTHHTEPLKNTIIFLVEFAIWIWVITILRKRRYKYRKPKFKVILILVVAIVLVCAFAGIEPMSSYKDKVFSAISATLEERQAISEAAKIAEAEKFAEEEATRKAEELAAEETRIKSEALARVEAERKAEEEAKAEEERIMREVLKAERLALEIINKERMLNGSMPTEWDDELYVLSKVHTQSMSNRGELFHSPMDSPIAENAWGGEGYHYFTNSDELAEAIVNSWMSSPLHKAWILHEPLLRSVVTIVVTPNGQYASWTFWRNEIGEGPELVRKISDEWRKETGESIPWIEWLYMKGYLTK